MPRLASAPATASDTPSSAKVEDIGELLLATRGSVTFCGGEIRLTPSAPSERRLGTRTSRAASRHPDTQGSTMQLVGNPNSQGGPSSGALSCARHMSTLAEPTSPWGRRRRALRERDPRPDPDRHGHRPARPLPRDRRLAGVGRLAGLERHLRLPDHVRADRPGRHRRLPPHAHPPRVQDDAVRPGRLHGAGLGRDRGPGHLVGRRPPQAPRVLRPPGRSAQPARRPRLGL